MNGSSPQVAPTELGFFWVGWSYKDFAPSGAVGADRSGKRGGAVFRIAVPRVKCFAFLCEWSLEFQRIQAPTNSPHLPDYFVFKRLAERSDGLSGLGGAWEPLTWACARGLASAQAFIGRAFSPQPLPMNRPFVVRALARSDTA